MKAELQIFRFLVGSFAYFCEQLVEDLAQRENYPECLYTFRVMTISSSIARLLPDPDVLDTAAESPELIDVPSVATLARNVAECCLQFFFVCGDDVSAEEKKFRRLVGMLHHGTEMLQLGREFEFEDPELQSHVDQVESVRSELQAHTFLKKLDPPIAKRALSGKSPIYLSRATLAKRMGLPQSFVAAVFRVLSHYTHSSPTSLFLDVSRYQDQTTHKAETSSILNFLNVLLAKYGLWLVHIFEHRPLTPPPEFIKVAQRLVGSLDIDT